MSITASWGSSNHLRLASGGGSSVLTLDFCWVYFTAAAAATVIAAGQNDGTSVANSREVALDSSLVGRATQRDGAGASSNIRSVNSISTSAWQSVAGAFISATHTEAWANADVANKGINSSHVSRPVDPTAYGFIGVTTALTIATSNLKVGPISRWDITGFTETDRDDLVVRLHTEVGGQKPNPRTVNDDVGEAWSGKLLRFWTLETNSGASLVDTEGSGDTWGAVGTVITDAEHPDMQTYGGGTTVAAGAGAITVQGQAPITYIPPRRMTLDVRIL